MDIAAGPALRDRTPVYQDGDRQGASSGESESLGRRKYLRTAENEVVGSTFRKPALPASATRSSLVDPKPVTQTHRRRSTLRDNVVRVPSGAREFIHPNRRQGSLNATPVSTAEKPTQIRTYLPSSSTEFLQRSSSIQQPSSSVIDRAGEEFSLVPTVSFDDFQDSMGNGYGASSLLNNFPIVPRPIHMLKDEDTFSLQGREHSPGLPSAHETKLERNRPRNNDVRQSLGGPHRPRQSSIQLGAGQTPTVSSTSSISFRSKRQSSASHSISGTADFDSAGLIKPPRKSMGPGSISSLVENKKASQSTHSFLSDLDPKPTLARHGSINGPQRANSSSTTSLVTDASLPSAITATTQARANKVKSLVQPTTREQDPNTPTGGRVSKGGQHREHTPSSSSGHKRQSTISGRASGLGARTISPTDARRLQRMSAMQAPPMPVTLPVLVPKEDLTSALPRPELPRLPQPSPSLIPRMATSGTPNSARTSPDVRPNQSLSKKSSQQSLLAQSLSTSRLPTPKPRGLHSSTAQYPPDEEVVPPVPAIPKAYESPVQYDPPLLLSHSTRSLRSSVNAQADRTMEFDLDGAMVRGGAVDSQSALRGRLHHQRTPTVENIDKPSPTATTAVRLLPDPAGRRNNNLQPLRLPPLNLMPLDALSASQASSFPQPSQEVENRIDHTNVYTPEPRRVPKPPSPPMTASKASFFRRQDDDLGRQKSIRSSFSQYPFADLMHLDGASTRFFDDSDLEALGLGTTLDNTNDLQRSTITPFASGSLPKSTLELPKTTTQNGGDLQDEYDLGAQAEPLRPQTSRPAELRPKTMQTATSLQTLPPPSDFLPALAGHTDGSKPPGVRQEKVENNNGGSIRRKLSIGWRRSSSNASEHPENKATSPRTTEAMPDPVKERNKLQKKANDMPPPKLPASASAQWTSHATQAQGDENWHLTTSSNHRPSLETARRKSALVVQPNHSTSTLASEASDQPSSHGSVSTGTKTRSLHSEQPQPVNTSHRVSSWGSQLNGARPSAVARPTTSSVSSVATRHRTTPSNYSASIKDKDDTLADDEMKRLSQKRKDVDSAARESEQLKARATAKSPMTPEQVLHDRHFSLNIFERGEIVEHGSEGIYFTGTKTAKKIIGNVAAGNGEKSGNYGYDDERGDYNIVLGDHLAYRYEVVDLLGKGSFGQVVRCVDHKHGGVVAVKIIRNKKRFHQQALVEVGILNKLREWDPDSSYATLSITSSFYFRSHLCIVTPCLSINLYELIRAHNFTGFTIPLIRRFARQLVACLVLLQRKRIIHCDLKPENILLCEARKADVRVIDFGSSCREEEKVYTYIQSRFYRSPEVILGSTYGLGIDMWSFGCILAELWTGYPIFPGENEQEQLACIMEIFGPPDKHLVERCTRKKLFFDSVGKPRVTVSSKGRRRRPSSKTLAQALKTDDEAFIDFIARCLRWDPDRRLKPAEAVNHPFITNLPLNQRPGIPDEARRAPRVKAANTLVPASATTGATLPSPIKKSVPQAALATPARVSIRPVPETPQTAVRNGVGPGTSTIGPGPTVSASHTSLSKSSIVRRHSTVATAGGAAAVAGSKRASNGAVLGAATAAPSNGAGNLAQLAARESMGGAGVTQANHIRSRV